MGSLALLWSFLFQVSVAVGAAPKSVLAVKIDGHIGPATVHHLEYALDLAEAGANKALLLEINTPGGLLESTRQVVALINKSNKPIITFVTPAGARAGSAGTFILLAGHLAVMEKGTNLGAASPIQSGGDEIGPTLKKKIMNDTRAFMRAISESRSRPTEIAEKFVTEALSLTAEEAVKKGVVDLVVPANESPEDFLKGQSIAIQNQTEVSFDQEIKMVPVKKRPIDQFLAYVSVPNVAYLLTTLGTLAIYLELFSGFSFLFLGFSGVISLIIGLIGLSTLPIHSGFSSLLFLGCVLMMVEVYVSGFGVFGITGFVAFLLGSLYLFDEPFISKDYTTIVYWVSSGVGFIMLSVLLVLFKRRPVLFSYIGQQGECCTDFIKGAGFIILEGQSFKAVTADHSTPLKNGDFVKVVGVKGSTVEVEPFLK